MSNKITDKATSTTTPTNWFVNIAGTVKQFTAAAFSSLIGSLIGPQTNAATNKETPVDADKFPLGDSADSNATKHTTWANIKATLGSLFAPLASPALTGTPTAPTAAAATNTTQIATTAFVRTEVANLVASSPGVLDTLDELAAALGDDANFATTVTSSLAGKAATIHEHSAADITSGTLDAARLPAPGTTTLGGVKRNAGSAGQFVTGIDTDGSLLRDTPAGGGGALVRGNTGIQGHTTPETPASAPPLLTYTFAESGQEGNLAFQFDGVTYTVYFSATDPSQTYWYDTSSNYQPGDLAAGLVALLSGVISGVTVADIGGGGVTFDNTNVGAAYHSQLNSGSMSGSAVGGGAGADAVPASGAVTEAQLVALSAGKTTKPVRLGICGDGVNALIQFALKTAGGSYSALGTVSASLTIGDVNISASTLSAWMNGVSEAHIIARMVDESGNNIASEDIPEGGSLTLWAIAEQV